MQVRSLFPHAGDKVVWLLLCCGLLALPSCRRASSPVQAIGGADGTMSGESVAAVSGKDLFTNYCAQCHGEKGDGNGPAARFLYPRPRNFGEAKFRIVSTVNGMPSDKDLLQVLNHGMPGSAMFSFGHLNENEKGALVAYVRQMAKNLLIEGFRSDPANTADPADLARDVDQLLEPGAEIPVPVEVLTSTKDAIARGKGLFQSAACVSCHGQTGKGDGVQEQRDNAGMPIHPRDFTRGIFKGGREPQQLYARILLGMPGSPMPASPHLKPAEIGDLINFVSSLSDPTAQLKVEQTRKELTAKTSPSPLDGAIPEAAWQSASPTSIVISPLWWRDYTEPDLQVRALHDGKSLAVRLSWNDATRNVSALRPQDFVDMAAIQFFKGAPEPFLGMGLPDKAIDVWHWRAGWQQPVAAADGILDSYRFDFNTAREAGNLITNPDQQLSAGSLSAKGFGSTTFRPKVSQRVSASSSWKDGRWTVVFLRPLDVGPDEGICLARGDRCSIAFAIWDGEQRDRNGQKLVSIWHDLKLE